MRVYRGIQLTLIIAAALLALLATGLVGNADIACAQEGAAVILLEATEVESEDTAKAVAVTNDDVELMREVTPARLYGLAAFWGVILLAVVLIRLQARDDERLYRDGYYDTE